MAPSSLHIIAYYQVEITSRVRSKEYIETNMCPSRTAYIKQAGRSGHPICNTAVASEASSVPRQILVPSTEQAQFNKLKQPQHMYPERPRFRMVSASDPTSTQRGRTARGTAAAGEGIEESKLGEESRGQGRRQQAAAIEWVGGYSRCIAGRTCACSGR